MERDDARRPRRLIELQDVEVLLVVADKRAFRRAAGVLGVEPSAVSRRVRAFEDRLGVSLFERDRTGVRLTAAGDSFLQNVRGALAQIDHATQSLREAGKGVNGSITVGITGLVSSPLSALLLRFRSEHPDVRLELSEDTTLGLYERVASRSIDVAFVLGGARDGEQEIAKLWSEAVFAGISKDDPRAGIQDQSIESFARDPFIISTYAQGDDAENFLIRELSDGGLVINVAHHRVSRETLMLMVGLGFGTALSCESETHLSFPNVAFVRLRDKTVPVSAIWLAGNDNPALRRFLSLTRLSSSGDTAKHAAVSRTPDRSP